MTSSDDQIVQEALAYAVAATGLSDCTSERLLQQAAAMTEVLDQRIGTKFSSLCIRAASSDLTGLPMPSFHRIEFRGRKSSKPKAAVPATTA
jgi:hypothetical protein